MHGISPRFEREVIQRAFEVTEAVIKDTVAKCDLEETAGQQIESSALANGEKMMMEFVRGIQDYKKQQTEFEEALVYLPKDELASVAASLVNLNSFKKKLSLALETVGGPVDLAVISKGDGFVWIDRKHYFKPELNSHFFHNRYGDKTTPGANGGGK